tara:strand:- start:294 stop:734 length:441 start_codon:yes stop_codon:yes gene_type:complete
MYIKMDINLEQTQRFNNFITRILDNLLTNDDYVINIIINSIYNPYNISNVLQESFENDLSLKKDKNLSLKKDKTKLQDNIDCDCCICMEKICKNQNIYKCEKCNDVFHYSCMNEWIKMNSTCPKCRINIDVVKNNFEEWINDNLNI